MRPVTVAAVLDAADGDHSRALTELLRAGDFSRPAGRVAALRSIAERVAGATVKGGFVFVGSVSPTYQAAAGRTERLAPILLERVDRPGTPGNDGSPSVCLVSVTVTVTAPVAEVLAAPDAAVSTPAAALAHLAGAAPGSLDAFYLHFAPEPGKPRPPGAASEMLRDLHGIVAAAR
jgi:hypothetical protein